MTDLAEEDAKLLALAKQARGRIQADQGAAVRDETGRSYSGASVDLPSMRLTALQLAVAQAVAAGARDLESALIVGKDLQVEVNVDLAPLADATSSPTPVFLCSVRGEVVGSTTVEPRG